MHYRLLAGENKIEMRAFLCVAVVSLALATSCGDDGQGAADDSAPSDASSCQQVAGSSEATLDDYYRSCGSEEPCVAPYECVLIEHGEAPHEVCLIPCCSQDDCPSNHGCVGYDLQIADLGADGYCAEPE